MATLDVAQFIFKSLVTGLLVEWQVNALSLSLSLSLLLSALSHTHSHSLSLCLNRDTWPLDISKLPQLGSYEPASELPV